LQDFYIILILFWYNDSERYTELRNDEI
jgi:hypothetical protein